MRSAALAVLATTLIFTSSSVHADKDSTCEAYASSAMHQIQKAAKYKGCATQGFFKGERWRNDFKYHYNACAERYDAATKAHRTFHGLRKRRATTN